jgi:hypothetical protein
MKRLTPLKPHEETPEVDHNIVHLCSQGFWWCRSCAKVTKLVNKRDHVDQEEYAGCFYCSGKNVKWHEPVLAEQEPKRKYG